MIGEQSMRAPCQPISVALVALVAALLFAARVGAADYRLNVIVELPAGDAQPFERAWMTLRDTLAERGYPYYTVVSESGPYRHFVSVIEEVSALETVAAFRGALTDSSDSKIRAAIEQLKANTVGVQTYISRHDRQLSYAPPGSYSGPYHRLQTFSYALEQQEALKAAFAALNAAWGNAGISSAFHVMWHSLGGWVGGGVGEGGGQVTMLTSAPSAAEHAAREARVRAATQEGYQAFDAALWSSVASSRIRYWLSRPELTLKPIEQ
jgi:hypothetical protein